MRIDLPPSDHHLAQLAGSIKYTSQVLRVVELTPGVFCLYSQDLRPAVITDDWFTILEVYRAERSRAPAPKIREPRVPKFSNLTFDL